MTAPESARSVRNWLPIFSELASFMVMVLGMLVLFGWALDLRFLTCLAPGCVAMNPMAAVALVLSGVGLWLVARRQRGASSKRDALGVVLAAAVTLVGAARLAQDLGAFHLQIESAFVCQQTRNLRHLPAEWDVAHHGARFSCFRFGPLAV